jgi:hypothetical protein
MESKVGKRAWRKLAFALAGVASAAALAPSTALAASATTGTATLVRSSSATLNAHIDPSGDPGITECRFEYVTDAAFGATGFTDLSSGGSALCSGTPPYTSAADVSAAIGGLEAGVKYRFRVVAVTTSSGTLNGADQSFTTVHGEIGSFGSDGTSGSALGSFGEVRQLGFDEAARRLYVIDTGVPGIWGFDVSNPPPPFTQLAGFMPLSAPSFVTRGIAVDNSALGTAGRIYYINKGGTTPPTLTQCYTTSAVPCPGFSAIDLPNEAGSGVVDSAGHLWVEGRISGAGQRLDEYAPTGGDPIDSVPQESLPTGLGGLSGIAMGSADDLFVLAGDRESVWRLTAASGYREGSVLIETPGSELGSAIAFDRRSHHLYIASESAISEYDAAGALVDEFAAGIAGAQFRGLAVDPANHFVYVSDQGSKQVRVFGAGAPFPAFELGDPAPLENTAATLHATVNPEGLALSDCHFEYVTEEAFDVSGFSDLSSGGSAPCAPAFDSIPADSADHPISAAISGLQRNTAYRYRLIVANEAGPSSAEDSFATPGPPSAETTGSPLPSPTSAVLSGRLNPEGTVTSYHFEYGSLGPCDANPCASTPEVDLSADEVQQFSAVGGEGGKFSLSFEGQTTGAIGAGNLTESSTTVTNVKTSSGAFAPGEIITNPGIPAKTTIEAVGADTLTLSKAAIQTGTDLPLRAYDIDLSAPALQVQNALNLLSTIGGVGGSVSVAGGRSFEASPSSYTVTFRGDLGGVDVAPLRSDLSSVIVRTAIAGGVGREAKLVAARVEGLSPGTTYHYRLIADNGNPDGASEGDEMTLRTAPAAPPSHGDFPGPPGSDRAYEQVSIPDSGGNPAQFALAFSGDGERAVYSVSGGTPISGSGTFFSQLLAERPAGEHPSSGWESSNLTPRNLFEESARDWFFFPNADLSEFVGYNTNGLNPRPGETQNLWRILPPNGPYAKLASVLAERSSEFFEASDDVGRVVAAIKDDLDRDHPADQEKFHLYDVSSGAAQLISLLPGGGAAACGVASFDPFATSTEGIFGFNRFDLGKRRWLSADGELAFFPSRGDDCSDPVEIYLREIDAGQTKLISGPAVSGPECPAAFLRATAEAAFFWTQGRLDAQDSEPDAGDCEKPDASSLDGDIYRYDLGDGALDCVTCVAAGREADVQVSAGAKSALDQIGVAEDGSAVYFASPHKLAPGAARTGVYRVEVASNELDYIAPGIARVGDALGGSSAVSPDGSVLVFRSDDPRLDPQGGATNGGFAQYYRYDDDDRSLICVSCPPDGSQPRGEALGLPNFATGVVSSATTYNGSPLSSDGDVFVFDTPSALVGADQNTTPLGQNPQHGQDVYEWREGRALLISDGLSDWAGGGALGIARAAPEPAAVSPSGRDAFFFASAQYTRDALDGYRRLYDARIGGGIVFAAEKEFCRLEVCQGTPKGAPAEAVPGTSSFSGPGNLQAAPKKCPKGKRKVRRNGKARCVKRHHHRANHQRRARR